MNLKKEQWTLAKLNNNREKISVVSDFSHRRDMPWTESQRQLLIDSMLRGYDVPKMYLRVESRSPLHYEVVMGRQPMEAILDFMNGHFRLPVSSTTVSGHVVADLSQGDLPDELRQRFDTYLLDMIVIDEATNDEIWEVCHRLRYGTTLQAQKVRDTMHGPVREFVKDLARHRLFTEHTGFSNVHLAHEHVATQIALIELSGGLSAIRDQDLDTLYRDQQDFDPTGTIPVKIIRVLYSMLDVCTKAERHLRRPFLVSFYCLISHLLDSQDVSKNTDEIAAWLEGFESAKSNPDDPAFHSYQESEILNPDTYGSVKYRYEYMLKDLLRTIPDIRI
jgi:hypothetical protein